MKREYIEPFWVGLMDGDGSIQVNHWKQRCLQFRLVIKLANTEANYEMLQMIADTIGGHVTRTTAYALWSENTLHRILSIITIFARYPPLTSRLQCQLEFLHQCSSLQPVYKPKALVPRTSSRPQGSLRNWSLLRDTSLSFQNDFQSYLQQRSVKYATQKDKITQSLKKELRQLPYFKAWLSGFIEAEACFCLRPVDKGKGNSKKGLLPSVSISQKNDEYLMVAIQTYFSISSQIRMPSKCFYVLETYRASTLKQIITHCKHYPLLGEKKVSFQRFMHVLTLSPLRGPRGKDDFAPSPETRCCAP
jgi:hypothetical protein